MAWVQLWKHAHLRTLARIAAYSIYEDTWSHVQGNGNVRPNTWGGGICTCVRLLLTLHSANTQDQCVDTTDLQRNASIEPGYGINKAETSNLRHVDVPQKRVPTSKRCCNNRSRKHRQPLRALFGSENRSAKFPFEIIIILMFARILTILRMPPGLFKPAPTGIVSTKSQFYAKKKKKNPQAQLWKRVLFRAYLHSKDPQLLRGQLFHLIGQDLCFVQDGKLTLGSAISTRKSRAHENEAPRKQQPSSVKPSAFIRESCPPDRRQTQGFVPHPPRHDGRGSAGWRNTESELQAERKKLQGKLLLQLRGTEYASHLSPGQVSTISSGEKHCNSFKSLRRRR